MIDISQATIESMVIHRIGCKSADNDDIRSENFYSEHVIQFIDEQSQYILRAYFSQALKSEDIYRFNETESPVFQQVSRVFESPSNLYDASVALAQRLYDCLEENDETHSEFYTVYFKGCMVDDMSVDAVGMFKSESKEAFLKILQNDTQIDFQAEEGINIKKMDKGCIVFNVEQEDGYLLKIHDSQKKDPLYWCDSFIDAKVIENEYFNTESFIKICKEFNEEILAQNESVRNDDRVKFLQNSLNYFQHNESFNEEQFKKETIGNPEVIEAFDNYKEKYKHQYQIEAPSFFDIDMNAVKKSKKYLRSVIKLDKNFHLYVHSRPDMLERGYDEMKGKSFYKVFFEVES